MELAGCELCHLEMHLVGPSETRIAGSKMLARDSLANRMTYCAKAGGKGAKKSDAVFSEEKLENLFMFVYKFIYIYIYTYVHDVV